MVVPRGDGPPPGLHQIQGIGDGFVPAVLDVSLVDEVVEVTDDGIVKVRLTGACAGCPMSQMTLKMGIENLLRHYIPEVTEVRPVGLEF